VEVDAAGAAALRLAAGATVEDLVVRSADPAAAGDALAAACADQAPVSLARVRVEHAEGAGRLAAGLRVSAPCAVTASSLTVDGAAVGILVSGDETPGADVALVGATLRGCGRGVDLGAGRLAITGSAVEDSEAEGIVASAATGDRELTVVDTRVAHNGDGGLLLRFNDRLELRGTTICGNSAVTPRATGFTDRLGGGIVLLDDPPPALVFRGNRVFSNAGDQILVAAAVQRWPLDGAATRAACGETADANYLGGYLGSSARGLYAASAEVDARFNRWASPAPAPTRDYEAVNGAVEAGVGDEQYCPNPNPGAVPTCD
jgi:hypothetical protein